MHRLPFRTLRTVAASPSGSTTSDLTGALPRRARTSWCSTPLTLTPAQPGIDFESLGSGGFELIAIDPTGERVLAGQCCDASEDDDSVGDDVALFDIATGSELWRTTVIDKIAASAFSPDGRHIAVGGAGGLLSILDAATGAVVIGPVPAHDGLVEALDYSSDGTQLVSSGTDSLSRLWDPHDLHPRGTFDPGDGTTPGGDFAAFVDGDKNLLLVHFQQVWIVPIDLETLTAHVCRVIGRGLTPNESAEILGERTLDPICPQ